MDIPLEFPLKFLALLLAAVVAGCEARRPDPLSSAPEPSSPLADGVREAVDARIAHVREAPAEIVGWMELAMTYEANGLIEDAAASYARVVELGEESPRGWFHLARTRATSGDLEGALAAAARASALAPAYAPAHWQQGEWLLRAGRLDEAATAFTRARGIDPSDPAGAWGLARIALQRGRAQEAVSLLAQPESGADIPAYTHHLLAAAHRMSGDERAAEREARLAGPPAWRDPWGAAVNGYRAGIHRRLQAARKAAAGGELPTAARILEQLRAEDPRDVNVAGMLADVYLAMERPGAAGALLLSTRDRLGSHYRVAFNLANAHEYSGDADRALAEFEECLRLHPSFGLAHFRRGRLLARSGRDEEALTSFAEAARLGVVSADLFGLRADALLRLDRHEEALSVLREGCQAYPEAIPLSLTRAQALIAHGEFAQARAALQRAEGLAPGHEQLEVLRERLAARARLETEEE
jgi:tetratricopeptide (TPR) repeat protein